MTSIAVAAEPDLPELLTLMRGYCDFYEVAPSDEALLTMSRALIADPACEGLQLIARDAQGRAIGFATIFWSWSTSHGARIGIMNDLFVEPVPEHTAPRGILGGSEVSQATTGATNIYMANFRAPAGARSRPQYHANCESALYMLSGRIAIHWGEHLERTIEVEPGDLLYVPPRETHIVENLSDTEPADYVVARDSPNEDSVEVPWAEEGQL